MSDELNQGVEAQLIEQRRAKLAALRAAGNAYPNDFRRDALAADILAAHADMPNEELERSPRRVSIAGRIMTRRIMGKAAFVHAKDMSGALQLYVKRDEIGEEAFDEFKSATSSAPRATCSAPAPASSRCTSSASAC